MSWVTHWLGGFAWSGEFFPRNENVAKFVRSCSRRDQWASVQCPMSLSARRAISSKLVPGAYLIDSTDAMYSSWVAPKLDTNRRKLTRILD